jgi:predicted transcriptional regulator
MSQEFRQVRLHEIADVNEFVSPIAQEESINMRSPAEKVVTDFHKVQPITISKSAPLDEAHELMKSQHVRLLLAVDQQDEFVGVITSREVLGRNAMAYMQQNGIAREDVQVKHIMVPKKRLSAITLEQVKQVKIGDIMQTLSASGEQHLLVVDSAASTKKICGIISASDVSRRLKVGFDVLLGAKSFADVEKVVVGAASF